MAAFLRNIDFDFTHVMYKFTKKTVCVAINETVACMSQAGFNVICIENRIVVWGVNV